ncbi:zinc-binding dehydrogenase [Nocardia sp. NPDC050378]|uniref:zinc-binding dehydrogenase n=1 Tax=Nocardia sp. NPDC050378 TaxID=3155400 RepID=UPI0033EBEA40
MRAAVVREPGSGFVTEEAELAAPIGREVLVDIKASGLCHTDHAIARFGAGVAFPAVLGHEAAGVVVAVGPDVEEFTLGDHVVGCLVQSCGQCIPCRTGRSFQCDRPESTLRSEDQSPRVTVSGAAVTQAFGIGGFAQQALIHENQLVKVDDRVPFPQAALLGCGVVTGAGAVINTANTDVGDTVVIFGVGGVGLNAISGAVLAGASTIIAIDVIDEKLAKAKRFGATHTFNSNDVDVVAEVLAVSAGGADSAFDFVGLPTVSRAALGMLRPGGGLYIVGSAGPTSAVEVNNLEMVLTQRRIQGVYMGSSTPKRDIPQYADLYLRGRLNLDDLVTRQISLDSINDGYDMLKEPGVTRVVITEGLS